MGSPTEYRQFLAAKLAATLDRETDEIEEQHPEFSANNIADAVAMALGRFANERGELKVAGAGPSYSPSV